MTDDHDAIVKRARECLDSAATADQENRIGGLEDARFIAGHEQWDATERAERDAAGRPVIQINHLASAFRQVTGDLRRTNPAINVLAADGDAKAEVAEVIEGLVRHIEQASDATSVYEGAAESAAAARIGNFRILADYCDDASFDQELKIERIWGASSVYWDPDARQPTRADAAWCLITEEMSEQAFKDTYPDKRMVDAAHDGATDKLHNWRTGGKVVVAEYFWKEPDPVTLYLLTDGTVTDKKPAAAKSIVRERTANRDKVMWAKVSGVEVLDGPVEFPSRYIPVVAITGEEIDLGGKVARSGVATHAKDPQRLLNYWASANAEIVAGQPKTPWLVTPVHVAGLEDHWKNANAKNLAFLPYNPDAEAPPPMRQPAPQPSSAVLTEIARATEDIRSTTGIHAAALGARSNETSGRAINARQQESDLSTSIYADNMGKAVAQCGRILVDMIPRIYDTPRTIRIVGKDDVESMVQVNAQAFDPAQGFVDVNKLTVGKYDVRVSVGPNYSTKRQQTAEALLNLVQSVPQVGQIAPDLIVKSLDIPDADQLAERLKSTLPPQFFKPEDLSPEEQQRAKAAQAQQERQQQIQDAAIQTDLRLKNAQASEKEAKAAVAGVEAQAALMSAQGSPEAPQDPRAMALELEEAAARVQEIITRMGLIRAQTRKVEAETVKTTVEALTPPPPPAPPRGLPQPAR